jgi:hypothetical protein
LRSSDSEEREVLSEDWVWLPVIALLIGASHLGIWLLLRRLETSHAQLWKSIDSPTLGGVAVNPLAAIRMARFFWSRVPLEVDDARLGRLVWWNRMLSALMMGSLLWVLFL